MTLVHRPQGQQRFDPLAPGLADADQDTGGKRHRGLPGQLQGLQAAGRHLVRRTVVRHALFAQARRGRLKHDAHGGAHLAQARDFSRIHAAGVDMRQQPGLLQHPFRHVAHIGERVAETQFLQGAPGRPVAQLRSLAQGEQRFLATLAGTLAAQLQHFLHTHEGPFEFFRGLREGAVVTDVTAQLRQGDEHLARISDHLAMPLVAQLRGQGAEGRRIGAIRQRQRLPGSGQFAGQQPVP